MLRGTQRARARAAVFDWLGRYLRPRSGGKLYAFDARGCGNAVCQPLWTGTIGRPVSASTPAVVSGRVSIVSPKAGPCRSSDVLGALE
jgi:hypothetical protein